MLRKLCTILLFLFGYLATAQAPPTVTLVGTISYPDGTLFNGTLQISLGRASALDTCVSPAQVVSNTTTTVSVVNGVVTNSPTFIPTVCFTPSVPYYVEFFDTKNVNIGSENWYAAPDSNSRMDVGTMVLSNFGGPITLSVPSPVLQSPLASQTITQPAGTALNINNLSVTGTLSVSNATFSGTSGAFTSLSAQSGSVSGAFTAASLNNVVYAGSFSGADCGAKISSALTYLGSNLGTIEVDTSCGTAAWSTFTLPQYVNLHFTQCGTYTVKGITVSGGNKIYGDGQACVVLQPNTATQSCIICGTGTSGSPLYYVFVSNIGFLNSLNNAVGSATGSAGISLTYAYNAYFDHDRFYNFDTGLNLVNTDYSLIDSIITGGNVSNGVVVNCCGPLYISHSLLNASGTYNGTAGVGNGVSLINVGSVRLDHNDVVQNTKYGISAVATAALPGGGAGDVNISQNTVDSNGNTGIYLNNLFESAIKDNWLASGRSVPGGAAGLSLNNSANVSITSNTCYGSGTDCFDINSSTGLAVTSNAMGGTSGIGINVNGTTHSAFTGNNCNGTIYQGFGAGMSYCIFEQASSGNNIFLGNTAQGMGTANWSIGSTSYSFNSDGAAGVGSLAIGGGSTYKMRQKVNQTTSLVTNCATGTGCSATITFPHAFPDTNWKMSCQINNVSSGAGFVATTGDPISTTQDTLWVYAVTGPFTITEVTCEGFE